jgi:hypothetical protein
MKNIIMIFIVFIVFSDCKTRKIEQYDNNSPNILNNEESEEKYSEKFDSHFYHLCWVFQPNEYYLLSDTFVYENPSVNSKKIGNLNIHDKVIIIEDVHNQQEINDTMSCWYKIKYNNLTGYIFGGNISNDTFIYDLDNNGINDYFQYRISRAAANWHIDTRKDIIIYINNKKIMTNNLNAGLNEYGYMLCDFNFCSFELIDNEVIITLTNGGPSSVEDYIFSINGSGNILFINHHKRGTFFENGNWIEYK